MVWNAGTNASPKACWCRAMDTAFRAVNSGGHGIQAHQYHAAAQAPALRSRRAVWRGVKLHMLRWLFVDAAPPCLSRILACAAQSSKGAPRPRADDHPPDFNIVPFRALHLFLRPHAHCTGTSHLSSRPSRSTLAGSGRACTCEPWYTTCVAETWREQHFALLEAFPGERQAVYCQADRFMTMLKFEHIQSGHEHYFWYLKHTV